MGASPLAMALAIAAALALSAGTAHAQTAPFTAETQTLTTTEVEFSSQIGNGSLDIGDWAVTDSGKPAGSTSLSIDRITPLVGLNNNPHTLSATSSVTLAVGPGVVSGNQSPAFTKFLITHGELSSTSAKPTVKYTRGDLASFGDGGESSDPALIDSHTATATDGVAPAIESAEFDGANVIIVTLSEHMRGTASAIEGYTYGVAANSAAVTLATADAAATPTVPVDYAEQATTSTLRIELAADASAGVAHTVTLPTALLDEADNEFTDRTEDATYSLPPFEAETQSLTTTLITFSGAVAGTPNHNNWSITDNDGGNADVELATSNVQIYSTNGVPLNAHNLFNLDSYTDGFLITHAELSSTGDTPRVTYSGGDLAVDGTAIPNGEFVEAADGIAPAFSVTTAPDTRFFSTVTVTFSEPLTLAAGKSAPRVGDWTILTTRAVERLSLSEIDTPMSWAPNAPTETAAATSASFTIPGIIRITGIEFTPAADSTSSGSLVDAGENAIAAGQRSTSLGSAADTTAPRLLSASLVSSTEVSATFSERVRLTDAAFDAGDWSSAGTTFSAARANAEEIILTVSRASSPTSVASGATLAYSGDSVTDVAGNPAAPATQTLADRAPPLATSARFVDSDTVEVTFTEAVASTAALEGCGKTLRDGTMTPYSTLTLAECLATPPPAGALSIRDASGDVAARGTGTPALSSTDAVLTFDIAPTGAALDDGAYTFHATTALSDAQDPPQGYREPAVAPSLTLGTHPTFTARFADALTIVLEASEELAASTVTGAAFTVSGPGLAATDPVGYTPGSTTVTLTLAGAATAGTEYTITPAATITDTAATPNGYEAGAITATYSPLAATAVSYSVLDGEQPRAPPYAAHARAGDTITLSITLGGEAAAPPTVLFVGKTAPSDAVAMTRVGSTNEWVSSYTVETAAQNAGLADGGFAFVATATSAAGTSSTITQASLPSATPPTIDRTPPTFTAETTTKQTIDVTFSEPVSGVSVAADWTVGGSGVAVSPLVLTADSEVGLRVGADNAFGSGETPTVAYTMPTGQGSVPLLDAAGHAVATASVTPADGVPPAVESYRFDGSSNIIVTFEESLDSDVSQNSPDLHGHATEDNVVHRASAKAVSGAVYTVGYMDAATPLAAGTFHLDLSGIADANGNAVGDARHRVTYDPSAPTAAPTFTAKTASATRTVVTFSEDVTGATAAADWTIAGATARGAASGTQPSVAPDADAVDRDTQVAVTSSRTITLLHDAIGTASTPSVAYAHSTAGRLAGAEGDVGAGTATAADGAAPTLAAATATTETTVVTFSEATTGTTSRGEWRVDGAEPTRVSPTELDGATTLTLTYAAKGTGATPAVSYTGLLSLADAADNHVAETSAPHIAATDGVAPTFTAAVTGSFGGRVTTVAVTFSEGVSQAGGKELPEAGDWRVTGNRQATPASVAYDLDADPATATLSISNNARLERSGQLSVTLDVPEAGEAARADSIVDAAGLAVADGFSYEINDQTAPVLYVASLISATELVLTLTENVDVTFAASDWEMEGTAFTGATTNVNEIRLAISPPRSTGLPDNAMLTYRGTGSVTDASNNALATGTSVSVDDDASPTVVSAMSVDADTVAVVFSEAIGTAPASALTLRNAAAGGAGDVVARGTGTPTIDGPRVTFDFVPVAVAPETEAPAALREGTYWFHGTSGIRDASDGEKRHNPRGTDAGVQLTTSVAPTFTAWFITPRTIELQPSENLDRDTAIADGSVSVTDAAGASVALADANPVSYVVGSVITVHLQEEAERGVTYTIAPATTITDTSGVPYGGATIDASYDYPYAAEARSRTETVVTFDDALAGVLLAQVWLVTEDGAGRAVSSVAPLDSSGNPVAGLTATAATGEAAATSATIASSNRYTQLLITHERLEETDATPSVSYAGGLYEGTTRVVGEVPVTATDGISPEVVSYRLPGPSDGGLNAHLIVVFSENLAHPSSHAAFPHLYSAPTGGSYVSDIIGTSYQSLGEDCNTCVLTIQYTSEPPEGTYYLAVTSVTDDDDNAYDKTASREVGEEGRIRIEYDRTPPVLGLSSFTSSTTIALTFDDLLSTSPALGAANFAVTVPDDTISPPDDDSAPDAVALDAETPVTYDAGSRTVTIHLAAGAVRDVVHTITPSSITNAASVAYAGGAASAAYAPVFSALALDGQTTRVTFVGDVAAILDAGDWSVTDHNAPSPTDRAVSGISGEDGAPAAQHELISERVIDIAHAAIGPGTGRLVIEYTVPAGGLSVGGAPLLAGTVWAVDATYAQPFEAETRSLTETVLTFDGGALSGTMDPDQWSVMEGSEAVGIASVAPLDSSGDPVASLTGTPRPQDSLVPPPEITAAAGYTQIVITHDPLDSTASTPTVTHVIGEFREDGLHVFQRVPVVAEDKTPPEVVSYRRGTDADSVGLNAHIVVVFSENMDFPLHVIGTGLYSGPDPRVLRVHRH